MTHLNKESEMCILSMQKVLKTFQVSLIPLTQSRNCHLWAYQSLFKDFA